MADIIPTDLDVDLVDELTGAAAAPAGADLVEGQEEVDAPKLPEGAAQLEGIATHGGAAVRYTLLFPVTLTIGNARGVVREEKVEAVTMHRATAADMEAFFNAKSDAMRALVCRLTRLPPTRAGKVWEKMDGADIAALSQVADFLLRPGRKTGR